MKSKHLIASLALAIGITAAPAQLTPKVHRLAAPLSPNTRELFDVSMSLFDASYDPQTRLIRRPNEGRTRQPTRYMVRESSWYALGLLVRDRAGKHPEDAQRALDILDAVLQNQYLDPSAKWYGTFKRSPEDALPHEGDRPFTSYDPNWRHFVGTTFEIILIEYPNRIPEPLKARMMKSIDAAVEGENNDDRLVPSYTNIALMYGSLWNFAAVHDGNDDWQSRSAGWNDEVFRLFSQQGAFNEFNAPTYYGVDLYGLALWREYGSTAHMRQMAQTMESGLWHDIADFYQPILHNIAGPYDRSYGMDMKSYVAVTGVWLRSVLSASAAPLPEHLTLATDHIADIWFAPQITLLGARIPAADLARFTHFTGPHLPGPHLIVRPIDSARTATAWIGNNAIWGGEFTSRTKDTGTTTQFHPATAQWRTPSGQTGWIRLTRSPNIDAIADPHGITLAADGDVTFRIYPTDSSTPITPTKWTLPGMSVSIEPSDAISTITNPPDCAACTDITYPAVHTLRLTFTPQ